MNLKTKIKVGDLVQVKRTVEAYYSSYAGNPAILLTPDIVGKVGSVRVPSVTRENVELLCVDFLEPATGKMQRAAVLYDNVRLVKLEVAARPLL